MSERVVVIQDSSFATAFLAASPEKPEEDPQPVSGLHELTPYGMLLASLGGCTAIVLHTYAQNHGVPLDEVELRLTYDRVFDEDCENCEVIDQYREQIREEILLKGNLDQAARDRLFRISKQCPIHKMLQAGIRVESILHQE